MSTKHTPEPWTFNKINSTSLNVRAGTESVAMVYANIGSPVLNDKAGQGEANARRIVACVNACKGMTTEDIEARGVVITPKNEIPALTLKYRQQRDELLAALQCLRDWCDADLNGAPAAYAELMGAADAAIAKVRA